MYLKVSTYVQGNRGADFEGRVHCLLFSGEVTSFLFDLRRRVNSPLSIFWAVEKSGENDAKKSFELTRLAHPLTGLAY
jgi:hypothetical protein